LIFISTAGVLLLATSAVADPRAEIRGTMDAGLRAQLVRAVGEVDSVPSNRFEARRRARGALQAAEALLRAWLRSRSLMASPAGSSAAVSIFRPEDRRDMELRRFRTLLV
jgi:hypothetical protein